MVRDKEGEGDCGWEEEVGPVPTKQWKNGTRNTTEKFLIN